MTEEEQRKIVISERLRCVGVVLAEFAIQRAFGNETTAAVLDRLATKLEHPELGLSA